MKKNDPRVKHEEGYGFYFYHGNQKNKLIEKNCKQCKKPFLTRPYKTRTGWATFCSTSCKSKQPAPNRRGAKHWNWKGGRLKDNHGYIQVLVGKENGGRYRGYILEHTMVMEKHLGRRLFAHENVHHKNGNRTDNRLTNLELWSSSQPPGQRVADKLAWAREIIKLYEKTSDQ